MKRVFTSRDRAAITVVRGLLAEEGIESTVLNESLSSVVGDVPFFLALPEVWVKSEDEPRALPIVARFESGQAGGSEPLPAWTCPTCGEVVEGQFTACWKCGEHAAPP